MKQSFIKARNEGWESIHGLMAENMKMSAKMIKSIEEVDAELSKFVFIIMKISI